MRDWIRDFRMEHAKAFWAIVIVAALALCGSVSSCGKADDSALPETGGASSQESVAETGTLSFTLAASEWSADEDANLVVKAEGETAAGQRVLERYKAVPNQKYDVRLPSGEYEFSLDTGQVSTGFSVYRCETQKVVFDGRNDENVVMIIEFDPEATAAAEQAEADRLAAEAAQREAEERAAAEQAAAEQAAAEAEAARIAQEQQAAAEAARVAQEQQAAAAAAQQAAQSEATVYIAASGNGSRYHTKSSCSGMKGTISLTVSQAAARGYTPCKKCA